MNFLLDPMKLSVKQYIMDFYIVVNCRKGKSKEDTVQSFCNTLEKELVFEEGWKVGIIHISYREPHGANKVHLKNACICSNICAHTQVVNNQIQLLKFIGAEDSVQYMNVKKGTYNVIDFSFKDIKGGDVDVYPPIILLIHFKHSLF